jgi:hypothetical protein
MTLRFTMEEFRKIPSNDKILFGVLIAIILVNSMIPRVREGATVGPSVREVSPPTLAFAGGSTMGVQGADVISITGKFTTSSAIPVGNTITFSFPSGYFTGTALTNARLSLTPAPAAGITLSAPPTSASSLSPAAGNGTLVFPVTGPTGTVIAPGTYTYIIQHSTPGTKLFGLSTESLDYTENGWTVETSIDTVAGTAIMPPILPYDAGSSTSDTSAQTSMTGRQKTIMANIMNLQNIEKQLFDQLTQESDPERRAQLVVQINQISKARADLYANMNDFAGVMQTANAETRNAVRQQYVAAQVVESQMNNAKTMLASLKEDKSNKLRLVEINNYYGRKYEHQTDIMKIVIITCAPILVISILLKKGFIPETISTGLIVVIIVVGIIAVARKLMDLNRRNNMNFDQYDMPFNPYAVSVSKTENTNLADLSKTSLYSSCVGASCCDGVKTVWNPATAMCIVKPATAATAATPAAASS